MDTPEAVVVLEEEAVVHLKSWRTESFVVRELDSRQLEEMEHQVHRE